MSLYADMTESKTADSGGLPADIGVQYSTENKKETQKKPDDGFDVFVAKVRDQSPAAIINNSSRINLGLRASADGFSVWSSLRKGSQSPWRFRASIITLICEGLGVIFSEKKVSEEQQQKYAEMSKIRYFFAKTFQALNPKDHIFETVGIVTIMNGIFTALSGRAQSVKGGKKSWEIVQGILTSIAGLFLTYTPDRERAQQIAHGLFFVRAPAALLQAKDAYFHGFPKATPPVAAGDWQQGVKWILNQLANTVGVFYGGIKKMPDGSIVHIGKKGEDITAPKQSRRQVSSADEYTHNRGLLGHPKTKVQQVDHENTVANDKTLMVEVA